MRSSLIFLSYLQVDSMYEVILYNAYLNKVLANHAFFSLFLRFQVKGIGNSNGERYLYYRQCVNAPVLRKS